MIEKVVLFIQKNFLITSAACLNFLEKQLSLGPYEKTHLVLPKDSLRIMRDGIESCVSQFHRTYRCPDGKRDKVIKGDDFYIRIAQSDLIIDDQVPQNFDARHNSLPDNVRRLIVLMRWSSQNFYECIC